METAKVRTDYRIVRRNGRAAIHKVYLDEVGRISVIEDNPVTLELPDDGTATAHLDLVDLLMDALSAHRRPKIDLRTVSEIVETIEKEMIDA